jgi:hypothetical protein
MILNSTRAFIASWLIIFAATLSLVAASWSIIDPQLYAAPLAAGSINNFLLNGSVAQDMLTVPLSSVLLVVSITYLKTGKLRPFIVMLGLATYLFSSYGFYVMQGVYTDAYLLYMAIFGLSVYSLILGLCSIRRQFIPFQPLSASLRIAVAVFLAAILLVVGPVWIILLLPAVAAHLPGNTYSVFVFDLTIIFPALAAIIYLLFRSKPLGSVLAGVALVKAFTLCLSLSFGEFYGPSTHDLAINAANLGIFATLTALSAVLLLTYFFQASFGESRIRQVNTRPLTITHEL